MPDGLRRVNDFTKGGPNVRYSLTVKNGYPTRDPTPSSGRIGTLTKEHIAKISLIGLYNFLVTLWGYLDGKTSFGGPRSVSISYQID